MGLALVQRQRDGHAPRFERVRAAQEALDLALHKSEERVNVYETFNVTSHTTN